MAGSFKQAPAPSEQGGVWRVVGWRAPAVRLAAALVFMASEIVATTLLFHFQVETDMPRWLRPTVWFKQLVLLGIVSSAACVLLCWPGRQQIAERWREAIAATDYRKLLSVNLALFAVLIIATVAFTAYARTAPRPPWGLFWLYCIPLAATGLSLLRLVAPFSFWRELAGRHWIEMLVALAAGVALLAGALLAQEGWDAFAGATLHVSHRLLTLYETDVVIDSGAFILGVGEFVVLINKDCSGYEGIALVIAFLTLFLWTFRATLHFPQALLLFPIGIVTIWLLNSVRIAALISIGAHVSPAVALGGFHSQAGWMAFLAVTIAILATVPRLSFFSRAPTLPRAAEQQDSDRLMLAYIVPFMVLMAAGIVAAASAPYDIWLYVPKVIAVGGALWLFRSTYRPLAERASMASVLAGLAIGVAWIATDPVQLAGPAAAGTGQGLGVWIASQPVWLAGLWLTFRAAGAVLVVPVVEELAFRGLLYRWIIARRFEAVPLARFSWIALLASSLLFGLMHQRWLAGALAGAVFAVLMVRSGRLSDAIVAHMAANALIVGWAIAARQWSLL